MLYRLARLLMVPPARLVYRPVVRGRRNVPRHGAVIIASNHLSFIDSVVIALLCPRPVRFLTKDAYFTAPGVKGFALRHLFSALGCVSVDRGGHRSARSSLEVGERILAAGGAFGIYPEGTRSRDGRLYRGRTGVAHLALTTGAPVVPVALTGTDRLQPVGRRLPGLHRVVIEFGTPLHVPAVAGEPELKPAQARRIATDTIIERIGELSGQPRADEYAPAPEAAA